MTSWKENVVLTVAQLEIKEVLQRTIVDCWLKLRNLRTIARQMNWTRTFILQRGQNEKNGTLVFGFCKMQHNIVEECNVDKSKHIRLEIHLDHCNLWMFWDPPDVLDFYGFIQQKELLKSRTFDHIPMQM